MLRPVSILLSFLSFVLAAGAARADDDHGFGRLKGEGLELIYTDHTLAGAVGELPVYASPLVGEFGIKVTHRAGGEDHVSELRYQGDVLSGTTRGVAFVVTRIVAAEGRIEGTLDGQPFEVVISSDRMDGHHYVDPRFAVKVGESRYDFALEGGAACIGCATKISYVVLSMLRVAGKL